MKGIFNQPRNYNEMLNRIGAFTFLVALICVWLFANVSPEAKALLSSIKMPVTLDWVKKGEPALYLLVPLLVAIIARIFRLHNSIATIFGIRKYFDFQEILAFLCAGSGRAVTIDIADGLLDKTAQRDMMRNAFYCYAGGYDAQLKIDEQLVRAALDRWTWLWVVIEASVVLSLTSILMATVGSWVICSVLLAVTIVLHWAAIAILRSCRTPAHEEVSAILADTTRAMEVRKRFDAL